MLFLWLVLSFTLFVLFHCIIIIIFFFFWLSILPCCHVKWWVKKMLQFRLAFYVAIMISSSCSSSCFLLLLIMVHFVLVWEMIFFFFPSRCCWISALVALVIKTANSVRNERKAPWLISLIYSLKFSSYTLKYWDSIVWTCGGVFANQTAQVIHFNKKQKWPEGNGNGDMGYDRSGRKYLFRGKLFIGRVSVTWFHSIDIFRFLNG